MKAESHFSRNKKQHDLLKPFIIKGHAEVDAEVACFKDGTFHRHFVQGKRKCKARLN